MLVLAAIIAVATPTNTVNIHLAPGQSAGPLVRALDAHFKCLELVPGKRGDTLRNCTPGHPTKGAWIVHAH